MSDRANLSWPCGSCLSLVTVSLLHSVPVIVAPYVIATGQAICEYFSDHALAVTFAVARKLIGHYFTFTMIELAMVAVAYHECGAG